MKKIIKLIVIGLLSATILTGCGCEKDKDSGVNDELIKDQQVESFEFTNTSLVYENNASVLETLVTNKSDKTEYLSEFDILVKDKDGNVIVTLTGFIGSSIGAGESRVIASTYSEDLTKAASIEYKIVR